MITDTNRLNFLLAQGAFKSRDEIDSLMVKEATDELTEPVQAHHNDDSRPPARYCVRDQKPIDPKRVMRGSAFCSTACRRDDARERRAFKASKACRLCGRKARPKPPPAAPEPRATDAHAN
jgi:hypothetical protein